jgi:hypothetical protein
MGGKVPKVLSELAACASRLCGQIVRFGVHGYIEGVLSVGYSGVMF